MTVVEDADHRTRLFCSGDERVAGRRTTNKITGESETRLDTPLGELRPEQGLHVLRVPVNGVVRLELAHRLTDGTEDRDATKMFALDARGSVVSTLGARLSRMEEAVYDAWGWSCPDFVDRLLFDYAAR